MFIFPKFLSLVFFGQIWFQIWSSSNWLKFGAEVHCYMLCQHRCLFFQSFCHPYNFGQIWKISKFYGQNSFHLVFSVLMDLHRISMLNLSKYGEQQVWDDWHDLGWFYEWQILRKITHQNRNQHITMCPCIKFQSIWIILVLPKFAQNYVNNKILKN